MNKDFNEKIKPENLATDIFRGILNAYCIPPHLTQYHKEVEEYYDEFQDEFLSGLTKEQKKDFNSLDALKNTMISTEFDYNILFGMRIKAALDELINNPLGVLNLYDSKAPSIRKMYRSVKQKKHDLLTE